MDQRFISPLIQSACNIFIGRNSILPLPLQLCVIALFVVRGRLKRVSNFTPRYHSNYRGHNEGLWAPTICIINMSAEKSPQSVTTPMCSTQRHSRAHRGSPPLTLFDLPLEIRDQIYSYSLTSPTGYVIPKAVLCGDRSCRIMGTKLNAVERHFEPFQWWSCLDSAFPMLRASKQIYLEANEHIYKRNTFIIFNFMDQKVVHQRLCVHVRYIWIYTEMFLVDQCLQSVKDTAQALRTIYEWVVHHQRLQTLTLNITSSPLGFSGMVETFEMDRERFDEQLGVLRNSWGDSFPQWKGVQRKLELCTGRWAREDREECNPYPVVRALHAAFGGELWINDRLCYKDGDEIVRNFESCL